MPKDVKGRPEGNDRDQAAPEPAARGAERPDAEAGAAGGVSREAYEQAVAEAVEDVHG